MELAKIFVSRTQNENTNELFRTHILVQSCQANKYCFLWLLSAASLQRGGQLFCFPSLSVKQNRVFVKTSLILVGGDSLNSIFFCRSHVHNIVNPCWDRDNHLCSSHRIRQSTFQVLITAIAQCVCLKKNPANKGESTIKCGRTQERQKPPDQTLGITIPLCVEHRTQAPNISRKSIPKGKDLHPGRSRGGSSSPPPGLRSAFPSQTSSRPDPGPQDLGDTQSAHPPVLPVYPAPLQS